MLADHLSFFGRQHGIPERFFAYQHSHGDVAGQEHFGHFDTNQPTPDDHGLVDTFGVLASIASRS